MKGVAGCGWESGAGCTEHGKAPVVDLSAEALGLLLGRGVLAEAKGVVQVERQRVRPVLLVEEAREGRVVAGLAALDVVLLAVGLDHGRELADGLEEANGQMICTFAHVGKASH